MALMKILQTGGTIPYDKGAFENLINQKIGEYNLPMKGEREVRNQLRNLMTYMSDSTGKELKIDPITKSYTLSGEGASQFSGNPDEIKKNWLTGKLNLKDSKDANSVAVAIYKSALDELNASQQKSNITTTPEKAQEIRELSDYMKDRAYGTSENFSHLRSQWKTDDVIQKETMLSAIKLIDEYKKGLGTQYDTLDPTQKTNIQAAYDAAKANNWKQFENPARGLNWNIYSALLTPEEINAQKEAVQTEETQLNQKVDSQKADALAKMYLKAGIGLDQQEAWKNSGYTEVLSNWGAKEGKAWIDKILANNGVTTLYNPTYNLKVLVKNGKLWNSGVTDRFSKQFGYAWENDLGKGLKFYEPGKYTGMQDKSWIKDNYANQNIGVRLEAEGIPTRYKLFGWSGTGKGDGSYNKDALGRRDFTKTLVLRAPNGQNIPLKFKNGRYYGGPHNMFSVSTPTGYHASREQIRPVVYGQVFNSIAVGGKSAINEFPGESPEETYKNLYNVVYNNPSGIPIDERFDRMARALTYHINSNPRIKNNLVLKAKYRDLVSKYVEEKNSLVPKKQQGGSFDRLLKLSDQRKLQKNSYTKSGAAKKAAYDASDTWAGMSTAEKVLAGAEIAGDAASIIPGVGAIGAGTSLIAGIARDVIDGGDVDWKKHAMNAGFLGLSLVGLGGAKAAAKAVGLIGKAGEIAKDATKISNLAKIGSKATVLEKASEFKGLNKAVNVLKEVADESGHVDLLKLENASKEVKDAFSLVKKAEKALPYTSISGTAKSLTKSAAKSTWKGVEKIANKPYVAYTNAALQLGTAVPAAINIGKSISETGDLSRVKFGDVDALVTGVSTANLLRSDLWKRHLIKGITAKTEKSFAPITLKETVTKGKKTITKDIEFTPNINNYKPSLNPINKEKHLKKWLKEEAKAQGIDENLIDQVSKEDLKTVASKVTGINYDPNTYQGAYSPWKEYKHKETGKVLKKYGYEPKPKVEETPKVEESVTQLPKPKTRSKKSKTSITKAQKGVKLIYPTSYIKNQSNNWDFMKKYTPNPKFVSPKETALGRIYTPQSNTSYLSNANKQAIKNAIPEFVANSINYINTSLANTKSADLQAQAYKESIVNLPLLNRIQYRNNAGAYLTEAERQKGLFSSQYNRIGKSTSDLDKSLAIQLEGVNKGAEISAKGYGLYNDASQKIEAAQRAADYETMKTNLGIVGQNMKSAAAANSQIPIVYSKLALAQATNLNNYGLGMLKLHSNLVQNANNYKLYDIYNSDKYKNLQQSRVNWQEEYDKAKEASKAKINPNYGKAWDEETNWINSPEEKALQAKKKSLDEELNKYKDLYNSLGTMRAFNVPVDYNSALFKRFKRGGSLAPGEYYESVKLQVEGKIKEKELEMFYKIIMHNNEMLQKALTNIFK